MDGMSESATILPFKIPPFKIINQDDRILVQLLRVRNALVEKAEGLSIQLEAQMNPGVAASLKGDEQAKAHRLFLTQATRIEAELNKLLKLTEDFRVHIY